MKRQKPKRIIWRGIGTVFSLVVIYLFNNKVFPLLFNKKLLDLLLEIDLIHYILALSLCNTGCLIYLFRKIKKISVSEKERINIGFSEVKDEELKKLLKEEHRFILQFLIKQDFYKAGKRLLLEQFRNRFPDKGGLELGLNMKELQKLGYIIQQEEKLDMIVKITDRACEKLSEEN